MRPAHTMYVLNMWRIIFEHVDLYSSHCPSHSATPCSLHMHAVLEVMAAMSTMKRMKTSMKAPMKTMKAMKAMKAMPAMKTSKKPAAYIPGLKQDLCACS